MKVPVSREKQVFYYYKRYIATDSSINQIASPPPEDRSLYVVHFDQEIKESFLLKTFQYVGEIAQTHISHFKPKASKKKQKRTLYFAIVVFKRAESLDKLLGVDGARYLQGKVNKAAAKTIKFSENPFLRDAQIDHIDSE